jgi:hypothetical protein
MWRILETAIAADAMACLAWKVSVTRRRVAPVTKSFIVTADTALQCAGLFCLKVAVNSQDFTPVGYTLSRLFR